MPKHPPHGLAPLHEAAAHDVLQTKRLATGAFDGFELTDNELDVLCDAVLAEKASLQRVKTDRSGARP